MIAERNMTTGKSMSARDRVQHLETDRLAGEIRKVEQGLSWALQGLLRDMDNQSDRIAELSKEVLDLDHLISMMPQGDLALHRKWKETAAGEQRTGSATTHGCGNTCGSTGVSEEMIEAGRTAFRKRVPLLECYSDDLVADIYRAMKAME